MGIYGNTKNKYIMSFDEAINILNDTIDNKFNIMISETNNLDKELLLNESDSDKNIIQKIFAPIIKFINWLVEKVSMIFNKVKDFCINLFSNNKKDTEEISKMSNKINKEASKEEINKINERLKDTANTIWKECENSIRNISNQSESTSINISSGKLKSKLIQEDDCLDIDGAFKSGKISSNKNIKQTFDEVQSIVTKIADTPDGSDNSKVEEFNKMIDQSINKWINKEYNITETYKEYFVNTTNIIDSCQDINYAIGQNTKAMMVSDVVNDSKKLKAGIEKNIKKLNKDESSKAQIQKQAYTKILSIVNEILKISCKMYSRTHHINNLNNKNIRGIKREIKIMTTGARQIQD